MANVHTPYHFVPLSKWVYMPDWAHLVSHDLPLQDGLSGSLEYTLKNHTPLCIGSEKDQQGILRVAKNPDGTPVIPATSLKGMIRNVLEIASFGKFNSVDKQRFSYRSKRDGRLVEYSYVTHDLITNHQPAHLDDAYFDMAELIFGTLRDNELGLKSRVVFSDAIAQQHLDWHTQLYQAKPTVLLSPKATGAYLEHSSDGKGCKSYSHRDPKLSGWKRYPARRDYKHYPPSNNNDTVNSKFELLKEHNTFKGKVVFHNLKHEELAALIWCLTLGNRSDNFHTLGHAKPLGAGSVQLKLNQETSSVLSNETREQLDKNTQAWCELFEQHMNTRFEPKGHWEHSPQIQHLLALNDEYIKKLTREERYTANTASSAFAKGRLAKLFNPDSEFHSMQQNAQEDYQVRKQKQHLKAQAKQEKQALLQADLPPFESCARRLELIVKTQDNLSKTEKAKNAKDLREILKTLKANDLTAEQCKHLISLYQQITIASKETKAALNYLEKQQ